MPDVLCVGLTYGHDYGDVKKSWSLRSGFSDVDFAEFLSGIDFTYDDGYGSQELFGFIWYKDGTFSQRGEHDGSEWWDYIFTPEIPEELK